MNRRLASWQMDKDLDALKHLQKEHDETESESEGDCDGPCASVPGLESEGDCASDDQPDVQKRCVGG